MLLGVATMQLMGAHQGGLPPGGTCPYQWVLLWVGGHQRQGSKRLLQRVTRGGALGGEVTSTKGVVGPQLGSLGPLGGSQHQSQGLVE